jgi:CheY-like chemotaxis protein
MICRKRAPYVTIALQTGVWVLEIRHVFRHLRRSYSRGPVFSTRSKVTRFGRRSATPQVMKEKILIVDDDDQLVDAYRDYLTGLGYPVDSAGEIEEAETLLSHFPYSIVITDLRLSRLNFGGLDLVRFIRSIGAPTRVVVLTAYGWPELKAEAADQGVDAFLRKPIRLSDLAKTLEMLSGGNA